MFDEYSSGAILFSLNENSHKMTLKSIHQTLLLTHNGKLTFLKPRNNSWALEKLVFHYVLKAMFDEYSSRSFYANSHLEKIILHQKSIHQTLLLTHNGKLTFLKPRNYSCFSELLPFTVSLD